MILIGTAKYRQLCMWVLCFICLFSNCSSEASTSANSEVLIRFDSSANSDNTVYKNALLETYVSELNSASTPLSANFPVESNRDLSYVDVEPIIRQNCVGCHRSNGTAPFTLSNYGSLKRRSKVIKAVLEDRVMPPWSPDNSYSTFVGAPPLNDSTRRLVIHWLDQNCPRGQEAPSPDLEGLTSPSPGAVIELANDTSFRLTSEVDAYTYQVMDPQLEQDLKLSSIDFRSNNPQIIHHRTLFLDTTNFFQSAGLIQEPKGEDFDKLIPLMAWSKGMIPYVLSDDFYIGVPAGAKLMMQTHYEGNGNVGEKEKTWLNLNLSESQGRQIDFEVVNKFDILYPPHEISTETISYAVEDSISLLGLIPHLHYLARKLECFAITEDNEKINLLHIPDWNYYFQGQYIFEHPVLVPAHSTIYMNVVIDNSERNPYQPNNPIRPVTYQQSSNDEMLVLVLISTHYQKNDHQITTAQPLY